MLEVNQDIKIQAKFEKVFKAISTIQGLRSWYYENIEGEAKLNGAIVLRKYGKTALKWKIVEVTATTIAWECVEGTDEVLATKLVFTLSKIDNENTLLNLSHTQWKEQETNFMKNDRLWAILLENLKIYTEAKQPSLV